MLRVSLMYGERPGAQRGGGFNGAWPDPATPRAQPHQHHHHGSGERLECG
jgi:hypothetical protein